MTVGERMLRVSSDRVHHLQHGCRLRSCWKRSLAWWTVLNLVGMLACGYLTVIAVGHLLDLRADGDPKIHTTSKNAAWDIVHRNKERQR